MASLHEVWLTDENGLNLIPLTKNLGGYFWRITDGIGPCKITMPASFDWKMLRPDMMIHYWRQPTGGQFGLWRSYFVRRWFPHYNEDGDIVTDLYGWDAVDLLRRRIIAAFMGSANATKAGAEVDDMMKDFVLDMESDAIAPTPDAGSRDWTGFSVQPDLVKGPQLDKSAAWGNVLQVCVDLAKASRGEGNEVFFTVDDILSGNTEITFEFRTTTGQPGQDVSDRVVFSTEGGTLAGGGVNFDYSKEINYIYGLGQGEKTDQNIQQVSDAARYGASSGTGARAPPTLGGRRPTPKCETWRALHSQRADHGAYSQVCLWTLTV